MSTCPLHRVTTDTKYSSFPLCGKLAMGTDKMILYGGYSRRLHNGIDCGPELPIVSCPSASTSPDCCFCAHAISHRDSLISNIGYGVGCLPSTDSVTGPAILQTTPMIRISLRRVRDVAMGFSRELSDLDRMKGPSTNYE